jgi:hypothetical protein
MINRRFDDRASCPAQWRPILNRSRASYAFLCLLLETANMRGGYVDLKPVADLNGLLRSLRFIIGAWCGPLNAAVSASIFLDRDLHGAVLVYALIFKNAGDPA